MTNKNSSQDFKIKKDFIDLQLELKKFLEETDLFSLSDILRDPLVVHSLDDYIAAYKEQERTKQIKKVLRKLLTLKKKNINIHGILETMEPVKEERRAENRINFVECTDFDNGYFKLNRRPVEKELTKERMVKIFKNHIKRLEALKKIPFSKPVLTRNFTVSSSHSHLIKKIEKTNDTNQGQPQARMGNEITTNASFRNGILRSVPAAEKMGKISPTVVQPPGVSNIVKANRSPRQMHSSQQEKTEENTQAGDTEEPHDAREDSERAQEQP